MMRTLLVSLQFIISCSAILLLSQTCNAFAPSSQSTTLARTTTSLNASSGGPTKSSSQLSPLPKGISPFEKSLSKNIDIQAEFRQRAKRAIDAAIGAGVKKIEVEFPPLIGGSQSKSQFDDFDNVQELDKNKEWTMLLAPMFLGEEEYQKGKTWLIFPDLKECELAKSEWQGQRYREATFTTIEAATNSGGEYDAPWGSNIISGLSKIMGKDGEDAGLLGDQAALDEIKGSANLLLVIQPGNGGPVEDWVNCEKIMASTAGQEDETPMVIINGALDKVKGGFYPAIFFPKLAATVDRFYKKFETVFYLKPFSDKGVYGWLYREYPQPWQVYYENVKQGKDGNAEVEYVFVDALDKRPTYAEIVSMLVGASQSDK